MGPLRARNQPWWHWWPVISVELLLVSLVVLFHVPLATVLLVLAGWLSLRLRGLTWASVGLGRQAVGWFSVLGGCAAGCLYQLFSIAVLVPLLREVTGEAPDLSDLARIQHNAVNLVLSLVLSWVLAAGGEELVYRGYLLNRITDLVGRSRIGWTAAIVLAAALFAASHSYQGISGMMETFVFAVALAVLYVVSECNLWLPIIAHGTNNTIGLVLVFLGWYS